MKEKKDFFKKPWVWVAIVICTLGAQSILILFPIACLACGIYSLYFFHSSKFKQIKLDITAYVNDCNELNKHIEELRSTYTDAKKLDYGEVNYKNVGNHNYKRKHISNAKYLPTVYDCSRTVCDGARKQPFKYLCKYFNISSTEDSLEQFETILNNFASAEEGKILSSNKRQEIMQSISSKIPFLIKILFPNKLESELGFDEFYFNELYFPTFSFRYISSGGNSGSQFDLTLDIPMLERFVTYLSETVKFKKSSQYQRRLMTPKFRQEILTRDNHICKLCENSTNNEPNLLLEVDHIIPLSKGGLTIIENLQTLCWKCNRSKGAKLNTI